MASKERRRPVNQVDETEFRDMCRRFAAAEIAPRWEELDRTATFDRSFYEAGAAAGLVGIAAPESIGGSALGCFEEAICLEETAKVNPNLPVALLIQNVAGSILYDFGTPEQQEIARQNIAGKRMLALAVTEPDAGSDIQNIQTQARRDGDDWIIDGMKAFITLGGDADTLVLLAQTNPEEGRRGMRFFAVDREAPGVVPSQISMYSNRPVPTYRVALNNVRVPGDRLVDAGFREIMAGFNRERVMVAARWLGHMQHAHDWVLEYAQTRHQFGKPIGSNQSIAFKLAQDKVDIEATRHLTYHAARRWDGDAPLDQIILDVSAAKLLSTQAVHRVTQNALHIAGGWGLSEELPAMRMALDALVAPVTVGAWEIQLRAIAKEIGLPCD